MKVWCLQATVCLSVWDVSQILVSMPSTAHRSTRLVAMNLYEQTSTVHENVHLIYISTASQSFAEQIYDFLACPWTGDHREPLAQQTARVRAEQMEEQKPTIIIDTVQADVATGVDVTRHDLGRPEWGAGGEGNVQEEDGGMVSTEAKKMLNVETNLDGWMIQCLDDVNTLLSLRQSITEALREGWMKIARARYALGPNRMSYPLFSLRPCAASTRVAVSVDLRDEDSGSDDADYGQDTAGRVSEPANLSFRLLKGNGHNVHSNQQMDLPSKPASTSLLRHRTTYKSNGGNGSLDLPLEDLSFSDHPDSDDEIGVAPSKGNEQQQAALYMFGALVSPDIRSAQTFFQKAVDLVIEMANAQTSVVHTHDKVVKLGHMLVQSHQNDESALGIAN